MSSPLISPFFVVVLAWCSLLSSYRIVERKRNNLTYSRIDAHRIRAIIYLLPFPPLRVITFIYDSTVRTGFIDHFSAFVYAPRLSLSCMHRELAAYCSCAHIKLLTFFFSFVAFVSRFLLLLFFVYMGIDHTLITCQCVIIMFFFLHGTIHSGSNQRYLQTT